MNICNDLMPILKIIGYVLGIIQWAIPVLLILLVTLDFFKVVSGSADEKESRQAREKAVKRLIWAVVVFLVPILVKMLFGLVGDNIPSDGLNGPLDWIKCFNKFM